MVIRYHTNGPSLDLAKVDEAAFALFGSGRLVDLATRCGRIRGMLIAFIRHEKGMDTSIVPDYLTTCQVSGLQFGILHVRFSD